MKRTANDPAVVAIVRCEDQKYYVVRDDMGNTIRAYKSVAQGVKFYEDLYARASSHSSEGCVTAIMYRLSFDPMIFLAPAGMRTLMDMFDLLDGRLQVFKLISNSGRCTGILLNEEKLKPYLPFMHRPLLPGAK